MTLTDAQIDRYSRQIIVPHIGGRGQERLLAARILLAGDARDIEAPLAYLIGAGVGTIVLKLSGDQAAFTEKRELNSDVSVRVADGSKSRVDLALVIIGSEDARKIAHEIANDTDVRALVIAWLDAPGKILVIPDAHSPRTIDARFGTRAEAADFIAMIATAEAFKLIAGYAENPSRATIEFDGHQTSARSSVMYKLWMFDFDNTIARLEREVDWAGGRLVLEPYLRSRGAPDELFARIPRGNLPLYDAYRTLMLHDSVQPKVTETLQHASEIIEQLELAGIDRAQPLDGAIEILAALKKSGAAVAIVTSNSSRTVARWFNKHSVESVDAIVGRDTLLGLKPAPDMLVRALELFSVDRSDAAFVGDSEADIRAAQSCGVRFYGIAPTDTARDRLVAAGATEVFASPASLAIHLNLPIARA
jgi:phosphoglycolate phosphatase